MIKRCKGYNEEVAEGKLVHVPVDPGLIKFYLVNRKPEDWKEKLNVDHSVSDLPAMLEEAFKRADKANEESL